MYPRVPRPVLVGVGCHLVPVSPARANKSGRPTSPDISSWCDLLPEGIIQIWTASTGSCVFPALLSPQNMQTCMQCCAGIPTPLCYYDNHDHPSGPCRQPGSAAAKILGGFNQYLVQDTRLGDLGSLAEGLWCGDANQNLLEICP